MVYALTLYQMLDRHIFRKDRQTTGMSDVYTTVLFYCRIYPVVKIGNLLYYTVFKYIQTPVCSYEEGFSGQAQTVDFIDVSGALSRIYEISRKTVADVVIIVESSCCSNPQTSF